ATSWRRVGKKGRALASSARSNPTRSPGSLDSSHPAASSAKSSSARREKERNTAPSLAGARGAHSASESVSHPAEAGEVRRISAARLHSAQRTAAVERQRLRALFRGGASG